MRLVWVAAVLFVGAGALMAFTGWNRGAAPGLLLAGILFAAVLLLARRRRR